MKGPMYPGIWPEIDNVQVGGLVFLAGAYERCDPTGR